jgi:putative transposase
MSQSCVQIYLHIVFSTKDRQPFLTDRRTRLDMHAYLAGTAKRLGCPAIVVGGVEDHVHMLCRFSKASKLVDLVRELKRESSKWVKQGRPEMAQFHWQSGYGAFSVGQSQVDQVKAYIRNQEAHHRQATFQEEFRQFLTKYQIEYDERHVWE